VSLDALPSSLEAGSVVRVLGRGELLFRQGDRAAAIYKVEGGRLRLIRRTVDDHLVILHTARRGEFFAEASLFAAAYHCDAVAAAQIAEAAAREAALKAEQEARDVEFAEQTARESALEAERQAARDARYAARKARKRKGR
jgi:CRP/FNR family transcriptional regulator, dissimilatory nitrate respiration regulator